MLADRVPVPAVELDAAHSGNAPTPARKRKPRLLNVPQLGPQAGHVQEHSQPANETLPPPPSPLIGQFADRSRSPQPLQHEFDAVEPVRGSPRKLVELAHGETRTHPYGGRRSGALALRPPPER